MLVFLLWFRLEVALGDVVLFRRQVSEEPDSARVDGDHVSGCEACIGIGVL